MRQAHRSPATRPPMGQEREEEVVPRRELARYASSLFDSGRKSDLIAGIPPIEARQELRESLPCFPLGLRDED